MSAIEPLPIDDEQQEHYPRGSSITCQATLPSPSGLLVCDRELFHAGSHSQGGAIAWPRR